MGIYKVLYRGFEKGFNKFSMVADFKIGFREQACSRVLRICGVFAARGSYTKSLDVDMPTNIQLELSRLPSSF